jgi:hypothetical protein
VDPAAQANQAIIYAAEYGRLPIVDRLIDVPAVRACYARMVRDNLQIQAFQSLFTQNQLERLSIPL